MLSNWKPLAGQFPAEQIFLIGDIHGRKDTLDRIIAKIAAIPRVPGLRRRFVSLGDVIDRGPKGIAAMNMLLALEGFDEINLLPGNHELMLLQAVQDRYIYDWFHFGGSAVLAELDPAGNWKTEAQALAGLRHHLGDHLERIASCPTHLWLGDLVCVHAGLYPSQNPETLRRALHMDRLAGGREHWAWMRQPFLEYRDGWDAQRHTLVIHGHSAATEKAVDIDDWIEASDLVQSHSRICLDAGSAGIEQIGWMELRGGATPQYRIGLGRLALLPELV